jgi:hypothetical protein
MVGETLTWRKSSRSGGGSNGSNCIEVADTVTRIYVRDSKDPNGGTLTVTPAAWLAFSEAVKMGMLDV